MTDCGENTGSLLTKPLSIDVILVFQTRRMNPLYEAPMKLSSPRNCEVNVGNKRTPVAESGLI